MHSLKEPDAIWTPDARANIQQEFGWSGGTLLENYGRFLADGGWARPGETVVQVFADWVRRNRAA